MKIKTIVLFWVMTLILTACAVQKEIPLFAKEFLEDDIVTKSGDKVSLLESNLISLWDGKKEIKLIDTFSGYEDKILAVAVSPDEKYLAVGGMVECDTLDNSYISLYRYKDKVSIKVLVSHSQSVNDLAFSSDGRYLVSASADASVKLWDMKDFELKQTVSFHKDAVYGVQMIKDADAYKLISVGYDGQIALHTVDVNAQSVTFQKSHKHGYGLKYVAFDKNKRDLAVCGEAEELVIYNLQLEHVKTIQTPMVPHRLRYGRDGKSIMLGGGRYSSRIERYKTSDYTRYY